ncbi:MAG: DUF134 domain-containing protein [Erysipelotrichaceae bacterium]|nr:DUF134 domain-containing protein [Erysipelotrichaceae bacterium]
MPRPIKERSIREKPVCCRFIPEKIQNTETVILTMDEFDVIRKCDYERLSQENCAQTMNVSRTTVQRIYASARQKIAEALILGKVLEVDGGIVSFNSEDDSSNYKNEKGEVSMKIAIGLDGEKVADHFGHCNDFRVYEIVDNKVINQEDIHDDVHVHQARPQFLKDLGVDVLIMNSMGKGAYNRLIALGIKTINAENKRVEEALNSYLSQELNVELVGHECHGCGSHGKGHHHG